MIVVTGATGNVGRPLVRALTEAGEPVTAVSRHAPDPGIKHHRADEHHQAGQHHQASQHHRADLAEPDTLKPALDGAEALFLLTVGDRPREIIDVARAGGVRRVVLLSSLGAGTRPDRYRPFIMFEAAVRESGLDWTILRPGGFASNTLGWAQRVRAERTVAAPFGGVGLPFIDPADIAEVAAAVLRQDGQDGQDGQDRQDGYAGETLELTGPAPVSPRQQAAAIGAALSEPVRFIEQTRAEARAQLVQFMPEPVADVTLDIYGAPTAAEQRVSPDVERVLRRTPATFAAWAARNVAAFR